MKQVIGADTGIQQVPRFHPAGIMIVLFLACLRQVQNRRLPYAAARRNWDSHSREVPLHENPMATC